jgi:hypothetical protein
LKRLIRLEKPMAPVPLKQARHDHCSVQKGLFRSCTAVPEWFAPIKAANGIN